MIGSLNLKADQHLIVENTQTLPDCALMTALYIDSLE